MRFFIKLMAAGNPHSAAMSKCPNDPPNSKNRLTAPRRIEYKVYRSESGTRARFEMNSIFATIPLKIARGAKMGLPNVLCLILPQTT